MFRIPLLSIVVFLLTFQGHSQKIKHWKGTYFGVTNCANCAGIATELILEKGKRYTLSIGSVSNTYFEYIEKGKFLWKKDHIQLLGIREDATASRYKLEPGQAKQLYLISGELRGANWTGYTLFKRNKNDFPPTPKEEERFILQE